jgi:hypothetical protein
MRKLRCRSGNKRGDVSISPNAMHREYRCGTVYAIPQAIPQESRPGRRGARTIEAPTSSQIGKADLSPAAIAPRIMVSRRRAFLL